MQYHTPIAKAVEEYYNNQIDKMVILSEEVNAGGKIRYASGSLVENICQIVWEKLAHYHGIGSDIRKGETDRIKCTNAHGRSIGMQVDKHCYVNGNLVLIQEAKSYLDRCYLIRASDDFQKIRHYVADSPASIIVAVENSVADDSYDFIMDEKNADRVFYLADGKRNSAKPIWKEAYRKDLNRSSLLEYIAYVDNNMMKAI